MPSLSPTMEKGNLVKWKKASGDKVIPGDVLVEIETDKAIMDFEYQEEECYLAKILKADESKDVKPIAVVVEDQQDAKEFEDYEPENLDNSEETQVAKEKDDKPQKEAQNKETEHSQINKEANRDAQSSSRPKVENKGSEEQERGRIYISPLAKVV